MRIASVSLVSSLILLASAASARADRPESLGDVRTVFVYGFDHFGSSMFTSGEASECETTGPESVRVTRCQVSGATLRWRSPQGNEVEIAFTGLVHVRTTASRAWTEYRYEGTWGGTVDGVPLDSPVKFSLISYDDEPQRTWGYLELESFGVTHWHRAARLR